MADSVKSGIGQSESLKNTIAGLAASSTRVLQVKIAGEELVVGKQLQSSSDELESDWTLVSQACADDHDPCFLLVRQEKDSWVFFSFVPDAAPVRSKMLYASTRNSLLKSLGSRVTTTIFATERGDLSYSSYQAHIARDSAASPLTAREQEMADIKQAEAATVNLEPASGAARSMTGASIGLEWSDEAKEMLGKLGRNEGGDDTLALVQLEIDIKSETIVPSAPQPETLSLPPSQPCYAFLRRSAAYVFIYSCPPSSPVKSRLVYSSSASGLVATARSLGVTVNKKIETSSPEEIDAAFIDAELGETFGQAAAGTTAPLPVSEKAAFARPARPGRRKA